MFPTEPNVILAPRAVNIGPSSSRRLAYAGSLARGSSTTACNIPANGPVAYPEITSFHCSGAKSIPKSAIAFAKSL